MERPATRYARSGNVHVAFQTVGIGPRDIGAIPEWVTHVEATWENAVGARPLC